MPKITAPAEFDMVVNAVRQHPAGASFEMIQSMLGDKTARRTLQRRLNELVKQGRLTRGGRNRGALYRLPPESQVLVHLNGETAKWEVGHVSAEIYVPMSAEASRLRDLVRRPVTQRTPVGYRREFLLDYRPNETWYLPSGTRTRLRKLGDTPSPERPAGTYARDVLGRLLIDLSWASSKLEGNTYTRLDTQRLIEHGEAAAGKDARETQMILNHKRAIEFLVDGAEDIGFDVYNFRNLHALLSENLLADRAASGKLRERVVEISGTVFHPLAIPQQIDEFFRIVLDKAAAIGDPFEQAFFLMVHIPYLQPFEDVNKRVSRLGANIPLLKHNLRPLSFIEVPERAYVEGTLAVYELNGVELLADVFEWAYERSCQQYRAIADSLPQPDPFRRIYRDVLADVIGEIVRKGWPVEPTIIEREAMTLVPTEDQKRFVEMAMDELKGLHEGNIARYRLRLSEFRAWKAKQR
ncbi:MAG: Fic family protein [Betaproteobacteria bacterium]|nr:Fic family protein [Betaproteobacteria bacterium]